MSFKEFAELFELKQLGYAAMIYAVPLTVYWTFIAG